MQGMSQQVVRVTIPGLPQLLTNTVTTGNLAFVQKMDPYNDVENWGTRFAAVFEEYRLLGAVVKLNAVSIAQGSSRVWWDEKYSSSPTSLESTGKSTVTLSNNSAREQRTTFRWRANDVSDMNFTAISSALTNSAYFKVFTNNAQLNAPIVATSLFTFQVHYILEFRGIME